MGRIVSVLILLGLLAAPAPAPAQAVAPLRVPSPRPDGWVTDLTNTLPADTRQAINRVGDDVRAQGRGELAVAVVQITAGEEPRVYATKLFNAWGVGDRERDDGVLVFVAIRDRKLEIVLGEGIDDAARVAEAQAIVNDVMVPKLKAGDVGAAVYEGAVACARRIMGANVTILPAEAPPGPAPAAAGPAPTGVAAETIPAPPLPPMPAGTAPVRSSSGGGWATPATVGGGAAGLVGLFFGGRAWLRYRKRRCPRCGLKMERLGEAADDAHLAAPEKVEERVGSVDYDVWACGCGAIVKLSYGAFFTRYSRCPKCAAATKHEASTTLREATYDHGGVVRIDESCANCDHKKTYTRTTPRRTRSSSSGSSFGSSGGSSGGRSSGFGGGSSAGRGAGGSW